MERYQTIGVAAVLAVIVAGCATPPDEIVAQDVSPFEFQDYSCKQISLDLRRKSKRVNNLWASLNKDAANDEAQMAVGMLLFWPTLLFLEGGDDERTAEYARLLGEIDALEVLGIQKQCLNMPEITLPKKEVIDAPPANRIDKGISG